MRRLHLAALLIVTRPWPLAGIGAARGDSGEWRGRIARRLPTGAHRQAGVTNPPQVANLPHMTWEEAWGMMMDFF